MKVLIGQLRSRRYNKRYAPYIAIVALVALLVVGCGTTSRPTTSAASSPGSATAVTSTDAAQNPQMILVPAGTYTIGSGEAEDTQPVHQVSLNAFRIDRDEVANAQYAEFLNSLAIQSLEDAPAGQVRSNNLPAAAVSLFIEGAEGNQQYPLIALDDEHSRIAIQNGRFVA